MDRPGLELQAVQAKVEERFFNANRSTDPTENALVEFIKRKNNKERFVEKTVKQIGFPRWNKIITPVASKSTHLQESDTSVIYYIPFVEDAENSVNAAMVIKATASDTTFGYLCDWQYAQKENSSNSIKDPAEYYAVFFMALDRHVFGHKEFTITDPNLFKNGNNIARSLSFSDSAGSKSGLADLLEPMEVCNDIRTYYTLCAYPGNEKCTPNCDQCWECTGVLETDYCWTEWIYTSGGGGGSGGSGTGGGGSGNNPPDPPPGNGGSGWNPNPPPCDSYLMDVLSNDTAFISRFKYLQSASVVGGTKEKGYKVSNRAAGIYSYNEGDSYTGLINWSFSAGEKVDGLMHSHYNGLNGIFSADDILLMAKMYIGGYVADTSNFFFAMTSYTGVPYLIKVTNTTKFRNFANRIIQKEAKNDEFTETYNKKFRSGDNTKNEVEFLKMLSEEGAGTGLTLFAAKDDSGTYNFNRWAKLSLWGNDVSESECPQNIAN